MVLRSKTKTLLQDQDRRVQDQDQDQIVLDQDQDWQKPVSRHLETKTKTQGQQLCRVNREVSGWVVITITITKSLLTVNTILSLILYI